MNEEELKALIGETAFKAMNDDQKKAALAKFAAPKPEPEPKPEPKGGKKDDEEDDEEDDLRRKAAKGRQTNEEKIAETRSIEGALKFNLGVQDFVKSNADLLPSEIQDILKTAEKESYDSAIEKSSAIKSSFIQSFFEIEANREALTAAQKVQLDDFLKLTKTGKESKASAIYENIFEPALETLRKVKKAEELGKSRSGLASGNAVMDGYKNRLVSGAKKTHLGVNEKGA